MGINKRNFHNFIREENMAMILIGIELVLNWNQIKPSNNKGETVEKVIILLVISKTIKN